jgi:PAS domain S-box-containing protein
VIDDNLDFLKVVELLLVKEKFIVSTAHDGLGCMNAIRAEIPDFILLDVLLPDTTGINICKMIKSSPEFSMIQIILISGIKNSSQDISAGLALGAVDYIVKPVRNSELLKRIEIAIKFQKTEKALVESEKRFRLLYENAPLSYQSLNAEGNLIDVNPTWLNTLGYDREEVIGRYFGEFMTPESAEKIKSCLPLFMAEGRIDRAEFEMLRKDGSSLFVSYDGKIGYDEFGNFKQSHCIFTDITNSKKAEEELKRSRQELKEFASHLQNVREEERILLAREIHDELAQILIALKIDMGLLKNKLHKGIETDLLTSFNDLSEKVDYTIKTSRKIMTGLRSAELELIGLLEAMKQDTSDFQEKSKINCLFETDLHEIKLNPKQSVTLLRIFQEALSNVLKHAKATSVNIILKVENGKLMLEIVDNGHGFDKTKQSRSDSYGMIGMSERVLLLEGELQISSEINKGTSVRVEMPYNNN